jgi:predicted transcriptional regulator
MPETPLTQDQILEIKSKVDDIDHKMSLLLRATPQAKDDIRKIFDGKKRMKELYLAVNNQATIEELAKRFSVTSQAISQSLSALAREGILDKRPVPGGNGIIYKHNQCEKIFRISDMLREK